MNHYLLNPGKSRRQKKAEEIKARYDAAQLTRDNIDHWINADALAPNAANQEYVRAYLRSRSRYEAVENNSYLKGIVLTLCQDFAGSGPSIRFTDKRLNDSTRKNLEHRFNEEYAKRIMLRDLLWRLRHAKCVDGEGFALAYTDRNVPTTEVQTRWQVFEAEQCTMPHSHSSDRTRMQVVDGIRVDRWGNVKSYYIMFGHPNETAYWTRQDSDGMLRGRWMRADQVIHWTRQDRPWLRGVPETVPALPLCAYLRRYNLAVLAAAETAASFAGVLQSEQNPQTPNLDFTGGFQETRDEWEPFESFPIERGMFTNLPYGYNLNQLRAEQPTDRHDMFVDSILREIARCMMMPFNVAVGFSGGYNFASGTLDRQLYNGAIRQEHYHCEDFVLRKILAEWWFEGKRIPGYFDAGLTEFDEVPKFKVRWDVQPEHADPYKVAQALALYWDKGFMTDEEVMIQRFNVDPEEHYDSLKRQAERRDELGMPLPGVTQVNQNTDEEEVDDEEVDDDESNADDKDEDKDDSNGAPSKANGNGKRAEAALLGV